MTIYIQFEISGSIRRIKFTLLNILTTLIILSNVFPETGSSLQEFKFDSPKLYRKSEKSRPI
jgi:hypothetical protein